MNRVELIMRRRQVEAFVRADPVMVVLKRAGAIMKTEAGGSVRAAEPVPLAPQQARVIPSKRRYDHGLVNTEAGQLPHTDYLLIARHTFDGKVDDWFTWQGDAYQLKGIRNILREESFVAAIDFYGGDHRG